MYYSRNMATKTVVPLKRLVQLPVSLDQLATTISRLSPSDLEALEFAFDARSRTEIIRRRKAVRGLAKRGKALRLSDLQEEFGGA